MKTGENTDISIVLSGEAGQGIQTLERALMRLCKQSGYYVYSFSEFMSRIRGGNNSTQIRISREPVSSFLKRIDLFVPFGASAMERFHDRITGETIIIGDPEFIDERYRGSGNVVAVPVVELARNSGGPMFANSVVLGLIAGMFCFDRSLVESQLNRVFAKMAGDVLSKNRAALFAGYEAGEGLARSRAFQFCLEQAGVSDRALMTGAETIVVGALAGGCNFVSSYPMSPSTDVLVHCARLAGEFGLIVEQAEDEICAVNMAIGSWYAGGRAMVTTSGGGFALMVEALSLAGAIESPLVIHLGQRPGPATGLPTRTEQADLLFALYAGHGEFPRVILSPGDFAEGVLLTQRAFFLADRYQVPVIILTDQYYLDSNCVVPACEPAAGMSENEIVKTDTHYRRYLITEDGISPRGIPGHGDGVVCLDSDEHDESGYITEDFGVRTAMVDKRLCKLASLENDALPPRLYGPADYDLLLVCWGSTVGGVREAVGLSGRTDIAVLHFSQVYPLHRDTGAYLKRAARNVIIENNATSQFGTLIQLHTGVVFDSKILKYDGMPFMADVLADEIASLPRGRGGQ
jgi:2-oxoglutarate/2-oxoacid ferredoxin oxidoreductase subunit alpha